MIVFLFSWTCYSFFTQDQKTAETFANDFFSYPLPPKTRVIKQAYDYGVEYGGGPNGSGGYPTVVAYQTVSSKLSEKEILEYYKSSKFELYFAGDEHLQKSRDGKRMWYEGDTRKHPSTRENNVKPITFILQSRTEFTSAFGEFARP